MVQRGQRANRGTVEAVTRARETSMIGLSIAPGLSLSLHSGAVRTLSLLNRLDPRKRLSASSVVQSELRANRGTVEAETKCDREP